MSNNNNKEVTMSYEDWTVLQNLVQFATDEDIKAMNADTAQYTIDQGLDKKLARDQEASHNADYIRVRDMVVNDG